jgi:hypothetical protein
LGAPGAVGTWGRGLAELPAVAIEFANATLKLNQVSGLGQVFVDLALVRVGVVDEAAERIADAPQESETTSTRALFMPCRGRFAASGRRLFPQQPRRLVSGAEFMYCVHDYDLSSLSGSSDAALHNDNIGISEPKIKLNFQKLVINFRNVG